MRTSSQRQPTLRSGQARPFYRRRRPKPAEDRKEADTSGPAATHEPDLNRSHRKFTMQTFYGWFIPHPLGVLKDEM
jgi:hypothetical protein